jgi:hypothetical protein
MYVWIVLPDLCVQFALDIQVTGDESLVDLRREIKQNKSEQQKTKTQNEMSLDVVIGKTPGGEVVGSKLKKKKKKTKFFLLLTDFWSFW